LGVFLCLFCSFSINFSDRNTCLVSHVSYLASFLPFSIRRTHVSQGWLACDHQNFGDFKFFIGAK
ncbi:hypothetical protein, partial [Nostoc favosum]